MANDANKPTAANIISSLAIKGAISAIPNGVDQTACAGFVPVLDASGQLNAEFIPESAFTRKIRPLSSLTIVDPNTQTATDEQTGSVVAPYADLHTAAANASYDEYGRCALLLMPGTYEGNVNATLAFKVGVKEVYIIGLGACYFTVSKLNIGSVAGDDVYLQDIRIDSTIQVFDARSVTCLGRTYVGGEMLVGQTTPLRLSSESLITSTDSQVVSYLSEASRIGNTSEAKGSTVDEALTRLSRRRIRIGNITAGDSGFDFAESSYTDLTVDSSDDFDFYDFRKRDKVFVDGINRLVKLNKNIVAETVKAGEITADLVTTKKLKMDALVLGGYKLTIDTYGYLIVAPGDEEIVPPNGVILMEDTGSDSAYAGTLYIIGVKNGRLYIANANEDSGSSSPSTSDAVREFKVKDSKTDVEYIVRAENGRLTIEGSWSSGADYESSIRRLYAYCNDTGLCYEVVAVANDDNGRVGLNVEQEGLDPKSISISQ